MSRSLFACLTALFVLAVVVAGGAAEAQPSLTEPEQAPAVGKLEVELLNPGEEPRRPIRFRPEKGASRVTVMAMDMQQSMEIGGVRPPAPQLPVQEVTMKFTVDDVAANGDIALSYEYTGWKVVRGEGVVEQVAAMVEQQVKPMVGTKGKLVTSDQGIPKEASIEVPEGVSPQLRTMVDGMQDSMKQMAAPVPAEPVGPGAEWRATSRMNVNGMVLDQTTTFKLLEVESNAYKLQVAVNQKADEQEVKSPMLPPGAVMKLKSLESSGTGETVLVTDSVLPLRSRVETKSASDMSVQIGGQDQAMKMNITMKMTLSPAEE